MSQFGDSLLKYDTPVFINKETDRISSKGRQLKVSKQHTVCAGPSPPPLTAKSPSNEVTQQQNEEILNAIFPPRRWKEANQSWIQHVSTTPCRRTDVVRLEELLNTKLQQREARDWGICPVRRELHAQCFDEIIRQVTVNCAERGLLLYRVRKELQMTIAAYQTLYESGGAFGVRKALQAEKDKTEMKEKLSKLEDEIKDLKEQLDEEKEKCESIEKREADKQLQQEKKHQEEVQFLKKTIQQLKNQMERTFNQ